MADCGSFKVSLIFCEGEVGREGRERRRRPCWVRLKLKSAKRRFSKTAMDEPGLIEVGRTELAANLLKQVAATKKIDEQNEEIALLKRNVRSLRCQIADANEEINLSTKKIDEQDKEIELLKRGLRSFGPQLLRNLTLEDLMSRVDYLEAELSKTKEHITKQIELLRERKKRRREDSEKDD